MNGKTDFAETDRQRYKGSLIRADVRGAIDCLEQCGETDRLRELQKRLEDMPRVRTGNAQADRIAEAYMKYFQDCFTPGSGNADTARMREPGARMVLEKRLREILQKKDGDMAKLEGWMAPVFKSLGWFFLGGKTMGFYGPYVWEKTEKTDYEVELPSGTESVTVYWMDGFIIRSWLAWLSGDEFGTGGWANDDGIYCVKSVYSADLQDPVFAISFLKHEAQHHADYRYGSMASRDLEYRAKLVELIYYPTSAFFASLLSSGDLSDRSNSHAYAAAEIIRRLSGCLAPDIMENDLRKAAYSDEVWDRHKEKIRGAALYLLEEHTGLIEKARPSAEIAII